MEAIPEELEVEVENSEADAEVQAEVTQADVTVDMSMTQSSVKPLSARRAETKPKRRPPQPETSRTTRGDASGCASLSRRPTFLSAFRLDRTPRFANRRAEKPTR